MLDEVEQRLLGPVHVLEPEHERLRLGEVRRPLVRRPGDLLPAPLARDAVEHPGREAQQVGDGVRRARILELLERLVGRVVGRDPGRHLHHLGQREVGEPLAEGQRAAGEDGRPLEPGEELPREAALPDPRLAVDRHELGAPVADDACVHVGEQVELLLAPDVRRRHVHGPSDRPLGAHDAADLEARPDALERPSRHRLGHDLIGRQPERGRADQDLARLGGLLEPRRDVQRLARRERGVAVLDDHLARLDADPHGELAVARLDDLHRRPHGALGVVLVRDRDAEDREDGVAGELLDRAAVRVDVRLRAVEEPRHASPGDLGVARGDEQARVDEIDEQRGRELPLHTRSLGSRGVRLGAVCRTFPRPDHALAFPRHRRTV